MADTAFRPALIIVDLQEDFCPPNGSLAVPHGRDVVPAINRLLDLPFVIKIATKDWHPQDHISFASNHSGKKAFVDFATITNPGNADETYSSRLWPDHCVQHTPGAQLLPELHVGQVDVVIEKGLDRRTEMYSAFYDPFRAPRCSDSGLAGLLREQGVSDVYVVGLAYDYCVRSTAVDAAAEGFRTVVVREGTRPVTVEEGDGDGVAVELGGKGVRVVGIEGEEVRRVEGLK